MALINKKIKKRQILLFILILLLYSNVTNGQINNAFSNAEIIEDYKSFIVNRMQKDSLIGVGISLILNDSVIWKEGFGYADKENQIPFTTKTDLCIGSVTKPITALGIMQLQEKGLIDIDKPLINYLPQFSIKTRNTDIKEITIRSVINNSSGIPNDIHVCGVRDSYDSIIKYLKNAYLAYQPDFVYHYSNIGYFLLGPTIFEVSGQIYPSYIQENILEPIGMDNSGFVNYKELSNVSKTYEKNGNSHDVKFGNADADPAGGLYSNIDDMTKFAQELIAIYHGKQGGIMTPETLREIFSVQERDEILDNINRGIGWAIFKNNSCFAIRFTGGTHLSNAGIIIAPEIKMAAIFQINTVGGLALAVDGINKFLKYVGLEQNDIITKNKVRKRNIEQNDIPIDSLENHIGLYALTRSVMNIKSEEDKLILEADFGKYVLYPVTKNEFNFGKIHSSDSIQLFPNERFIFKNIKNYNFLFWEDENYKLHNFGFLVKPQNINNTWIKRLGKYKVVSCTSGGYDQISELELLISENNLLQLKIVYKSGLYTYNMYIESDKELIFCGFGEPGGETVRFEYDDLDLLMNLFGLTLKKID